jgi:hypothetical protein
LISESDDTENEQYNRHQSSGETIQSISDIDGIDDADSDEKGDNRIEQSQVDLPGKWSEIDEIDAQLTIKPSTDESRHDDHSDHFRFST